jgi:AcrR family transcriptional regulator
VRDVSSPTPQRARSPEAKRQREQAILRAARSLAAARTVREVTLTDIAAAVGMHKSAMLRYFETREQIFLALAAEGWREWSGAVRARLGALPDAAPEAVAAALADTLAARPLFCDLLAHAPLNLERNVTLDTAYRFKLVALAESRLIAADLASLLGLTKFQAIDVVTTATGMAGAFWQMAASGTPLSTLHEKYPELAYVKVEVKPRLTGILADLLTGMQHTRRHDGCPPGSATG